MKRRRHKKGNRRIIWVFLFFLIVAGAAYLYTAPEFERVAPQIKSPSEVYWNQTDPLKLEFSDNVGLKHYEVTLSDGQNSVIVAQGELPKGTKRYTLPIEYPKKSTLNPKAKHLTMDVTVADSSLWNFVQGNIAHKQIKVNVDHTRPNVNILSNSYSITQGGSALVVFQADDDNLDNLSIQAGDHTFMAQPYKKEGYYAALVAWPFDKRKFSAKIIATDKAGNKRVTAIPFYLRHHKYRVSWIKARDSFIDGKITDLASSDPEYANITDKIEKLRAINETMRLKNEALIHTLSQKISDEPIKHWKIQKFYPLKNGARVASYGDERHYYYKDKGHEVSHSYHVGYDLASTKMAPVIASNKGKVVFAGENGIYGNMPLIDHGLGLYSLYGHCSKLLVKEGDEVTPGEVIARTGTTGLALGDHLHFGVLVQGIEVRPVEWFDGKWIRTNIDDVFKEADKIIAGK